MNGPPTVNDDSQVTLLAEAAGLRLPPERLPALEAGLLGTRRISEALASIDYGETEPAFLFHPPAPPR